MSGPWEQYQKQQGQSVTQEEGPWSQYSIAEQADASAKKELSTFDYIANEARKGTVDSAVLGQAILDTFVMADLELLKLLSITCCILLLAPNPYPVPL